VIKPEFQFPFLQSQYIALCNWPARSGRISWVIVKKGGGEGLKGWAMLLSPFIGLLMPSMNLRVI